MNEKSLALKAEYKIGNFHIIDNENFLYLKNGNVILYVNESIKLKNNFEDNDSEFLNEFHEIYSTLRLRQREFLSTEHFRINNIYTLHYSFPPSILGFKMKMTNIFNKYNDVRISIEILDNKLNSEYFIDFFKIISKFGYKLILIIKLGINFNDSFYKLLSEYKPMVLIKDSTDNFVLNFNNNNNIYGTIIMQITKENFKYLLELIDSNIFKRVKSIFINLSLTEGDFLDDIILLVRKLIVKSELYIIENISVICSYLLHPDIGTNNIIEYYSSSTKGYKIDRNKICESCWAQKICWATRSYNIWGVTPRDIVKNVGACDFIRELIEECIIGVAKLKASYDKIILHDKEFKFLDYNIKSIN